MNGQNTGFHIKYPHFIYKNCSKSILTPNNKAHLPEIEIVHKFNIFDANISN